MKKILIIFLLIKSTSIFCQNSILDWTPCNNCNGGICEQEAGMIFFSKKQLCKSNLLNPPPPQKIGKVINEYKKSRKGLVPSTNIYNINKYNIISIRSIVKTCDVPSTCKLQLVGYYIEPTPDPNSANNIIGVDRNMVNLKFYPVWNEYTSSMVNEIVCSPIVLNYYYKVNPLSGSLIPQDLSGVIISALNSQVVGDINHSTFQFNNLAINENFMKAFISHYELRMIIDHCQFLGITGAYLGTGNLVARSWNQDDPNEGQLERSCNSNFFTYRFVGFIEDQSGCFPNDNSQMYLRKSNTTIIGDCKRGDFKVDFDHSVPAETWAVPCPPRWKPE